MASNMQPSGPPQPPRPPMMGSGAPPQNLGPPMPMQFRPVAPPQQPPQFMQPAGQQFRPVGQPMPGMPGQMPHFPQPGQHLPHSGQGPPSSQAVPMAYQQARPMSSAPTQQQQQAMEGLRLSEAKLTVYVHPSNANDVRGAVARQLSSLLFTYEDRFDGVLLGHKFEVLGQKDNIKDKVKAKILNGLVPYFGVPVHATLLMFSPQPGMILEGKVEMLGKVSIHAVVLGVFSVAIMSDDIHEKFKFRRKGDGGRFISRSGKQHVIKRGSMIRFSVKRVDTEMNCHITGSLIPPHTGSRQWLSEHDDEYASKINRYVAENSSSKRRSRDINIKVEQDEQENGKLNNINGVMNYDRPRKSRKRSLEE